MMSLSLTLIVIIALAGLFSWSANRAWRSRRAIVKWPGVIVSGLLAALCLLVTIVILLGLYRLNMSMANSVPDIQVAGSPEQVARGERLANLCANCHSTTGQIPLDGSADNFTAELGVLYAPNLTPGGPLKTWSDGQIIRAIREGVDNRGRALLIMPSQDYHTLSDADAQALVAYLRTQPAVERQTPERQLGLLGTLVTGAGVFATSVQKPITGPVTAPASGPTAEYGQYLITISSCRSCHGDDLKGGVNSFVPIGPNLPAIVTQWSADEFIETMRTGVDPYGNPLDPERMPWPNYSAAYTDEELKAIYVYIRSLTHVEESSEVAGGN